MRYRHFKKNIKGRDFAVGDIHGCFNKVAIAMNMVKFDKTVDRLFSVGDLVDRGPDHYQLLEWLEQPWFFPVRGNHEEMLLDVLRYPDNRQAYEFHFCNGGSWFYDVDKATQMKIAIELNKLPFMIEVDTSYGSVGIIHADVPFYDWIQAIEAIESGSHTATANAIWSRTRQIVKLDIPVRNIDRVYVGHSTVKKETILGNVHNIDGGMGFENGNCILVQFN